MKNVVILVCAALIFMYFFKSKQESAKTRRILFYNETFTEEVLADPCEGKEYCIAIYLAPWCPHCKASQPMIRDLQLDSKKSKMYGIKLFIGNDSKQNTGKMSSNFLPPVFDDTRSKLKGLFPKGVPTWVVMNMKNRKIVREDAGLPQDGSLFLQHALNL